MIKRREFVRAVLGVPLIGLVPKLFARSPGAASFTILDESPAPAEIRGVKLMVKYGRGVWTEIEGVDFANGSATVPLPPNENVGIGIKLRYEAVIDENTLPEEQEADGLWTVRRHYHPPYGRVDKFDDADSWYLPKT